MPVLVVESVIAATLQAVFDFHADVRNVRRVQPPGFNARARGLPERLEAGAEFEMEASAFGFPQRWRVKILEVWPPHGQPPRAGFEDRALAGPFSFFSHRHEFFQEAEGCVRVRDVVDFDPPGGRWAWLWVIPAWLVLRWMFWHRHRALRRILQAQSSAQDL